MKGRKNVSIRQIQEHRRAPRAYKTSSKGTVSQSQNVVLCLTVLRVPLRATSFVPRFAAGSKRLAALVFAFPFFPEVIVRQSNPILILDLSAVNSIVDLVRVSVFRDRSSEHVRNT